MGQTTSCAASRSVESSGRLRRNGPDQIARGISECIVSSTSKAKWTTPLREGVWRRTNLPGCATRDGPSHLADRTSDLKDAGKSQAKRASPGADKDASENTCSQTFLCHSRSSDHQKTFHPLSSTCSSVVVLLSPLILLRTFFDRLSINDSRCPSCLGPPPIRDHCRIFAPLRVRVPAERFRNTQEHAGTRSRLLSWTQWVQALSQITPCG